MAAESHLEILLRSVSEWNAWRQAERGLRPDLSRANLNDRDLRNVDFTGTFLVETLFSRTRLEDADFTGACLQGAVFADTDLSRAQGLDRLDHSDHVSIDLATLFRSRGRLPESLLRSAGVPEDQLPALMSLCGSARSYRSCFLSYASQNDDFAAYLVARLQEAGVTVWFAPNRMRVGEPVAETIVSAASIHEGFLVVLSSHARDSHWVGAEVHAALEQIRRGRDLLILPLLVEERTRLGVGRLPSWWTQIQERWHIRDFSAWQRRSVEDELQDLLRALATASAPSAAGPPRRAPPPPRSRC